MGPVAMTAKAHGRGKLLTLFVVPRKQRDRKGPGQNIAFTLPSNDAVNPLID